MPEYFTSLTVPTWAFWGHDPKEDGGRLHYAVRRTLEGPDRRFLLHRLAKNIEDYNDGLIDSLQGDALEEAATELGTHADSLLTCLTARDARLTDRSLCQPAEPTDFKELAVLLRHEQHVFVEEILRQANLVDAGAKWVSIGDVGVMYLYMCDGDDEVLSALCLLAYAGLEGPWGIPRSGDPAHNTDYTEGMFRARQIRGGFGGTSKIHLVDLLQLVSQDVSQKERASPAFVVGLSSVLFRTFDVQVNGESIPEMAPGYVGRLLGMLSA